MNPAGYHPGSLRSNRTTHALSSRRPSPFSVRERVRGAMDATMSCFSNSTAAIYVSLTGCRQAHPITPKLCTEFQSNLIVLLCAGEIPVQRASSLRGLRLEQSFKYVAAREAFAICHLSNAGLKVPDVTCLHMRN